MVTQEQMVIDGELLSCISVEGWALDCNLNGLPDLSPPKGGYSGDDHYLLRGHLLIHLKVFTNCSEGTLKCLDVPWCWCPETLMFDDCDQGHPR